MSDTVFDFAIVGAGMAGASLAAELASDASVLMLEAEDHPGYHSTGRSAAFWEECYGGPDLVPLTLASGVFLREKGFLNTRGALYIGKAEDRDALDSFVARFSGTGATIARLDRSALEAKVPGIRPHWCEAIWEPACADIDVGRLHNHYLSAARAGRAELAMRARLTEAVHTPVGWRLAMTDGRRFTARKLINAAGAWADAVAGMAGCRAVGITPFRRTVAQIATSPAPAPDMPLVLDISGKFYFKSENGRLWLSPHDEEPTQPCDAAPEELAIAQAIDRLQSVVSWDVQKIETKWAGLRSFAPDRLPVYGADPRNSDFIWFAGQGGFGIQTAPAAAALAASILLGRPATMDVTQIDAAKYAPSRFG